MNLLISERDVLFDEHIYGHLVKFSQKAIDLFRLFMKETQFQFNIKIKYVTLDILFNVLSVSHDWVHLIKKYIQGRC